jgi:threonyl-tRNA synthetase
MKTTSAKPDDFLHRVRHSLSHVLAQAVLQLRPGTTLGFGPAIDDGFYYDFILPEPLSEEDFPAIEKKMRHIIKQAQPFTREDLPQEQALARLDQMQEPYKREYARELFAKKNLTDLSFYKNGPFLDMCDGPHVENTRELPEHGFKLRSVAGAYWRGDSRNVMMTRIYAYAFTTREELESYVKAREEALARDHKKLGRELDLFVIDEEIGKGLPLWLPAGTVLREELEKLAKELEFKAGYQRVATPHLSRSELYHKTGHLPYYADRMYPMMELKEQTTGGELEVRETYCLKPMNCPHHHRIFAARPRSYKDLPLRLAEYGQVYRWEDAGALSGLLRVRGMAMNDAHIYCTPEQVIPEFVAVMDMHREVYKILGIADYYMRLSLSDPEDPKGKEKYIDDPVGWKTTEDLVRQAMRETGLPYTEVKGEAAFYGPKIDVQFRTVTGREETASTSQVDFGIAQRLDLKYVGSDNAEHRPLIIHRAPLGTHERFVAFLIEHYGGAFPTWLAPVQVQIITVSDRFNPYAEQVLTRLRSQFVRAEFDRGSETLNKKVRTATTLKIPNLLVLGEREMQEETVTLRRYGSREQQTVPLAAFESQLHKAIAARSLGGLDFTSS